MEGYYDSQVLYLNVNRKDWSRVGLELSKAIGQGYSIYNVTPDGIGGVYYVLRKKTK